jgi:prepilin-type N-terminal cleavage/methylation domain-containing protein
MPANLVGFVVNAQRSDDAPAGLLHRGFTLIELLTVLLILSLLALMSYAGWVQCSMRASMSGKRRKNGSVSPLFYALQT